MFYENELKTIIGLFKLSNNPIVVKGSSVLKDQIYYSDFDLFSKIKPYKDINELKKHLLKVFQNIHNNNDIYFIELKIQMLNGEKHKYHINNIESFFEQDFDLNNIEFIKIDCVVNIPIKCKFMEASVIYQLDQNKQNKNINYDESMRQDIMILNKEKKYYKVLKRYIKISRKHDDKEIINKFFNSETGFLYQQKSNLEAMQLLLKYFNSNDVKRRCTFYLKLINKTFSIKKLNNIIHVLEDIINCEAKKLILKLNIN